MKAFSFRLEQALRWRETQAAAQKARLAAATGRALHAQAALDSRKAELAGESRQVTRGPTGTILGSYGAYARRSRVEIQQLHQLHQAAKHAASAEMNRLLEANRGVRLLENLKETEQCGWRRCFEREMSAFADEAFLCRLQSKKPTGA